MRRSKRKSAQIPTNKKNPSKKREAKILIKSSQLSRADPMRKLKVTAILLLDPMAVKMMAEDRA